MDRGRFQTTGNNTPSMHQLHFCVPERGMRNGDIHARAFMAREKERRGVKAHMIAPEWDKVGGKKKKRWVHIGGGAIYGTKGIFHHLPLTIWLSGSAKCWSFRTMSSNASKSPPLTIGPNRSRIFLVADVLIGAASVCRREKAS